MSAGAEACGKAKILWKSGRRIFVGGGGLFNLVPSNPVMYCFFLFFFFLLGDTLCAPACYTLSLHYVENIIEHIQPGLWGYASVHIIIINVLCEGETTEKENEKQKKKGADRGRATTQFQAATSRSFEELLLAGVQWQPHRCCHCLFSPAAQRNEPFCADDEHNNIRIRKLLSFPHFFVFFVFFRRRLFICFLACILCFYSLSRLVSVPFLLISPLVYLFQKYREPREREKRKTAASLIATPGSSSKRAVVKVSLKWSY